MKYILVCYKPSGEDTCRGCLMERWDSEFELFKYDDVDNTIATLGQKMFENTQRGRAPEWEFTLFVDGLEPYDCVDNTWVDVDTAHKHIFTNAELVCKELKDQQEKKEILKARKIVADVAKNQEAQDRAALARLKAKYERV